MIRPLLAFTAIACAVLVQPLVAQEYGRPRQPEVRREGVQCTGTVKGVRAGIVQMVTGEGEQWLVKLESRPQSISYSAEGDASIVKQGMFVMFNTRLGKRGQAAEPISDLTIFTPREGYPVGVVSENALTAATPKAAANFFAEGDKPEQPTSRPKPVKDDENTVYRVAGQITKISRTGELTINAGGNTIKADVAEDAKVNVSMGDLSWLKPGDNITFRGWYAQGQKGQAWASEVTASSTEPLKDESNKKKPLPGSAEKPAVGQEGDKPAADGERPPAEGEKKAEAQKKVEADLNKVE
jgi:hypothetical protein